MAAAVMWGLDARVALSTCSGLPAERKGFTVTHPVVILMNIERTRNTFTHKYTYTRRHMKSRHSTLYIAYFHHDNGDGIDVLRLQHQFCDY